MSTAARLVRQLAAHGVAVWAEGERLCFWPRSRVHEREVAALRAHKRSLVVGSAPYAGCRATFDRGVSALNCSCGAAVALAHRARVQ